MDIQKYWRDVIATAEELPNEKVFYLTSLNNADKGTTAGRVCDMTNRKEVARRIVEATHRLSTPAEIERFHADQKRQTEELAEIELKRKQQFAMPQELQTLVAMAARGAIAENETKKPTKEK